MGFFCLVLFRLRLARCAARAGVGGFGRVRFRLRGGIRLRLATCGAIVRVERLEGIGLAGCDKGIGIGCV